MNICKLAELYYYDGPFRGTYQFVPEEEIKSMRLDRYVPLMYSIKPEVFENNQHTCHAKLERVTYILIRIPSNAYSNNPRYVLILESK